MDYNKTDRNLYRLHNLIGSVNPHPANFDSEQKKVFQTKLYNPMFKYGRKTDGFSMQKKELLAMRFDSTPLGRLFHEKAIELMLKIQLMESLGTPRFTQHSLKLYGLPPKDLVAKARKFLSATEYPKEKAIDYSSVSAVKKFMDTFMTQGLNWKVEARQMTVRAAINPAKRTLYLNKDRKFTDLAIKKLMVHEVGTHVMRAENGRQQHLRLFSIGFPGYLPTEEGLAVYNEEEAGVLRTEDIMSYAGRVVAVDMAVKNSFSTIYNELLEYFPREEAFTLTTRAKRGLAETSKPGGYTKDYLYLQGYLDVKHYLKNGGKLSTLYLGKIGLKHIPLLKKLKFNGAGV